MFFQINSKFAFNSMNEEEVQTTSLIVLSPCNRTKSSIIKTAGKLGSIMNTVVYDLNA